MRTVIDIPFGVGGTVAFDAPARPSAALATVYRWSSSDNDPEIAEASATIEANPSTTTDAACGFSQADRRLVPLTATTGCVGGRVYKLTGSHGQFEMVEVLEVDPGVSVTAKHPLMNDYASGATFESTRCTLAITGAWVNDEANLDSSAGANPMYRVRWKFTVGGVVDIADTYFSLVRYVGRHGVTPQDVDLISAGWLDRLPVDHRYDQGRRLIDDAYREVKIELHGLAIADESLAEAEIVDELTRYKAAVMLDAALASRYETRKQQLVSIVSRVPQRDAQTGAATNKVSPGITGLR